MGAHFWTIKTWKSGPLIFIRTLLFRQNQQEKLGHRIYFSARLFGSHKAINLVQKDCVRWVVLA